ncbi:MAG TPA: RIP metalloprotease RseP, partial [Stellaceae bacterium]|nr:RIP metalloprotease RseP [Stellaceae bacterium]
ANFLFAIVVFAAMFATVGQPYTPPQIGEVDPGTAASAAGIKAGDTILAIDGRPIDRFEDIQRVVGFNVGTPITLLIKRDSGEVTITVTPRMTEITDHFGDKHKIGLLGVKRTGGTNYVKLDPLSAIGHAAIYTWDITGDTLKAVAQMVTGRRSTEELGGPLKIGQMADKMAQGGLLPLIGFAALLSVNLGLINLFPIPVLDGGHLLFYAAEAIRGKPLGPRAQEYGFRFGLALVMMLMVFATWNDLVGLKVVEMLKGLVT